MLGSWFGFVLSVSLGKRRLIALLLSCRCYRSLTLPRGAIGWFWHVIVAFPGHTLLLYKRIYETCLMFLF